MNYSMNRSRRSRLRRMFTETLENRCMLDGDDSSPSAVMGTSGPVANEYLSRFYQGLGKIEQIGNKLQRATNLVTPIPEIGDSPLVQDIAGGLVDVGNWLSDFARQASAPPDTTFLANDAVSPLTFAPSVPRFGFQLILDGGTPIPVLVTTPESLPENLEARANRWAEDLTTASNQALAAQDPAIAHRVTWKKITTPQGPRLRLSANAGTVLRSLDVTLVRLAAADAPPEFGQPAATVEFDLALTVEDRHQDESLRGTEHDLGAFRVRLPRGGTAEADGFGNTIDNALARDLLEDMNAAFANTPVANGQASGSLASYVQAILIGPTDARRIAIVARNTSVRGLRLTDRGGLSELGFSNPEQYSTSESNYSIRQTIGLKGQGANREGDRQRTDDLINGRIPLIDAIRQVVNDQLGIPAEDCRIVGSTVLLRLHHTLTVDQSLTFDFNQSLDVGPLGTLELIGQSDGHAGGSISFVLNVGFDLEALIASIPITTLSSTALVNNSNGLRLAVGIAATNAPRIVFPASPSSVALNLELIRQGVVEQTQIRIASSATSGNTSAEDLLADIRTAIAAANIQTKIEAILVGGRVHFRTIDKTIDTIRIIANRTILGHFGFPNSSSSPTTISSRDVATTTGRAAYPDLLLKRMTSTGVIDHYINLDGQLTIGAVADAIRAQSHSSITVVTRDNRLIVRSSAEPIEIQPVTTNGITSGASSALQLLGPSVRVGANHEITGGKLSDPSLADRAVFLQIPDIGNNTAGRPANEVGVSRINGSLQFQADEILIGVGLGYLQLRAENPMTPEGTRQPLQASAELEMLLLDPGTTQADGRIFFIELNTAKPESFLQVSEPTAAIEGSLAVRGELFSTATTDFSGDLATIRIAGTHLNALTIEVDDTGFDGILEQLSRLSPEDIMSAIGDVIDDWARTDSDSPIAKLLHSDLPIVGTSLGEAVDFIAKIRRALINVVATVDTGQVETALAQLLTSASNLPLDRAATGRLESVIQQARRATSDLRDADSLADAAEDQITRARARLIGALTSVAANVEALISQARAQASELTAAVLDDLEEELRSAVSQFASLLPGIQQIGDRLERALLDQLPDLGELAQVKLDIVQNSGSPPDSPQYDIIVGLDLSFDVDDFSLAPQLDLAALSDWDLGLELSAGASLELTDLSAQVQLGIVLQASAEGFEAMLIVDPPAEQSNPNVIATQFTVQAMGQGQAGVSVRVGGLDLVEGSVEVSFGDDPSIGDTIGDNSPAKLKVGFEGGSGPYGAVRLSSAVPVVVADGLLTGSLDVSLLGQSADDLVTVNLALSDLGNSPGIVVDEAKLASLFEDFDFDLQFILQGLGSFFDVVSSTLQEELDDLPMIGGGLEDLGSVVEKLRVDFIGRLESLLQDSNIRSLSDAADFLADELTVALRDLDLLPDDQSVTIILEHDRFEVQAELEFMETIADINFDTHLPGLPLDAAGGIEVELTGSWNLGVGIDRTRGVYILDRAGQDISFAIDAGFADDTSLSLDLFLLSVTATDSGSELAGSVNLDWDSQYTGSQLQRIPLSRLSESIDVSGGLSATLDLNLETDSALEALPKLRANLQAAWGWGTTDVDPSIHLNDVKLDVGPFLRDIVGPLAEKVRSYLQPLDALVRLLQSEIPGVSDLSEIAGEGPIRMLDLLPASARRSASQFINLYRSLTGVREILSSIGGDGQINLGSIGFEGDLLQTPDWNIRNDLTSRDGLSVIDELVNDPLQALSGTSILSALNRISSSPSDRTPDRTGGDSTGGDDDALELGLNFHFIEEPKELIKVLLGQTIDLVTWNIPELDLSFDWSQSFPILPFPPIDVEVGLEAALNMKFSVGLDTRGLKTDNFLDGFYFGDRADVATGDDINEANLSLFAFVGAELDAVIASVGIRGGITGELSANWRDPDEDGKFYVSEIAHVLRNQSFDCLFNLEANIGAKLQVVWELFWESGTIDIANVNLLSPINNKNSCPARVPAHVSNGQAEDDRGFSNALPEHLQEYFGSELAPEGTLLVHSGHFASMRDPGRSADTSEQFTIEVIAPKVVRVQGMGMDARFGGVERIVFDGGAGNDQVDLTVAEGVNVAASGVPMLIAYGGNGRDTLLGGPKADYLIGGKGDDRIDGRQGDDEILGEDGSDRLFGGLGQDVIHGGRDGDEIYGDLTETPDAPSDEGGDDVLYGEDGQDRIFAGAGADRAFGGAGNDVVYGGNGSDSIDGGDGHDFIDGGNGDDLWLYGGLGNDCVRGGSGADNILGGWGNDVLFGHFAMVGSVGGTDGERIEGGPDDDFICGTSVSDIIHGGTALYGYEGLEIEGMSTVPFDRVYPILQGGYDWTILPSLKSCSATEPPELPAPLPGNAKFQVFRDHNADSEKGANELFENGRTVQLLDASGTLLREAVTADLDSDNDGRIDPQKEVGVVDFADIESGTYRARLIRPLESVAGQRVFIQTSPRPGTADEQFDIIFTVSSEQMVDGGLFGVHRRPEIRGSVWNDSNGNGTRESFESPRANHPVYIDGNLNAVDDATAGDVFSGDITARTDAEGNYRILLANTSPQSYVVRQTLPSVFAYQTSPINQLAYNSSFETGVSDEWSPNRWHESPNGQGMAGRFSNETVTFDVDGLAEFGNVVIEYDLYIIGSWDGKSETGGGEDRWSVSINNNGQRFATTFANDRTEFVQQDFPNELGSAGHEPGTGRDTSRDNHLGYPVSPGGFASTVYHRREVVRNSGTSLRVQFQGSMLEAALCEAGDEFCEAGDEFWAIDNFRVTVIDVPHRVEVDYEEVVTVNFGLGFDLGFDPGGFSSLAAAHGPSSDKSANGREPGSVSSELIGGNTTRQASGESVITHRISGIRWNDLDGDGVLDANEENHPIVGQPIYVDLNGNGVYDAADRLTYTDSHGYYAFDLEVGTYTIRELLPDGWEETFPKTRPLAISQYGTLAELDPITGAFTHAKPIVVPPDLFIQEWIGVAVQPLTGVVFAVGNSSGQTGFGGESYLFRVDPITGMADLVSKLSVAINEGDLAFQPTTNQLFAVTERTGPSGSQSWLMKIDTQTGQVQQVGAFFSAGEFGTTDPSAMTFDDFGGLWVMERGAGKEKLIHVNPGTGGSLDTVVLDQHNLGQVGGLIWDRGGFVYTAGDRVFPQGSPPAVYRITTSGRVTKLRDVPENFSGLTELSGFGHIVTVTLSSQRGFNFGNQVITVIPDGKDWIESFDGKDRLYGDNRLFGQRLRLLGNDDVLVAGLGKDELSGQQGDDVLWGGGNQSAGAIIFDDSDNDAIDGGEGINTVMQWAEFHQQLSNVQLSGQGIDTLQNIQRARLMLGNSGRTISAIAFTAGPVELIGGSGDDELIGTIHDDVLNGGAGSDVLIGWDGNDRYVFNSPVGIEADQIDDSRGNETLDFSLYAALSSVNVDLNRPNILIGTRTLSVNFGTDATTNLIGTSGNDTLRGNGFSNRIEGGLGNDTIYGSGGSDTILGGAGDDNLYGESGVDTFIFESSSNGFESDFVSGGTDSGNIIDFRNLGDNSLLQVDLGGLVLSNNVLAVHAGRRIERSGSHGITNVLGSDGDDRIADGSLPEFLLGGKGNDTYIFGSWFQPAPDFVVEKAGEGFDTIDFSAFTAAIGIDLNSSTLARLGTGVTATPRLANNGAFDEIEGAIGGSGADILRGNARDNVLDGRGGNDQLIGRSGNDIYVFSPVVSGSESDSITEVSNGGIDTISFAHGTGVSSQDITIDLALGTAQEGASRSITFSAQQIENTITGSGNDNLQGSSANNQLYGAGGNDTLNGGFGSDVLIGGSGNDRYLFSGLLAAPTGPGTFLVFAENDKIFEPDVLLDRFGAVVLDDAGLPTQSDGGVDSINFSELESTEIPGVVVDLRGSVLAHHLDLRTSSSVPSRFVSMLSPTYPGWLENIIGSEGNDSLVGNDRNNQISGLGGGDLLNGLDGDDVMSGGSGSNTIFGGSGDDIYAIDFTGSNNTFIESLGTVDTGFLKSGGRDTIALLGATSDITFDLASFDSAIQTIQTILPNVRLGLKNSSQQASSSQFDSRPFENVVGAPNRRNTIRGNSEANILVGGNDRDLIDGRGGRDILVGLNGIDTLEGGTEEDIVIGGFVDFRNNPSSFVVASEMPSIVAIHRAWLDEQLSSFDRQDRIAIGVGTAALNARLVDGTTVLDDGQTDSLQGGGENDWLLEPNSAAFRTGAIAESESESAPSRLGSPTFDINRDGSITAIDALLIINYLNSSPIMENDAVMDVNGDFTVTALDALLVINAVNQQHALSGESNWAEEEQHAIPFYDIDNDLIALIVSDRRRANFRRYMSS